MPVNLPRLINVPRCLWLWLGHAIKLSLVVTVLPMASPAMASPTNQGREIKSKGKKKVHYEYAGLNYCERNLFSSLRPINSECADLIESKRGGLNQMFTYYKTDVMELGRQTLTLDSDRKTLDASQRQTLYRVKIFRTLVTLAYGSEQLEMIDRLTPLASSVIPGLARKRRIVSEMARHAHEELTPTETYYRLNIRDDVDTTRLLLKEKYGDRYK